MSELSVFRFFRAVVVVSLATMAVSPAQAIVVVTSDSIPDGTRTNFVSFSGISFGSPTTYSEDGVLVQQINGDFNDITSYLPGGSPPSWYPNGGDNGYTRITRVGGSAFANVGFLRGSGNAGHIYLAYQLLLGGTSVMSGIVSHATTAAYLGFMGGGFDEIRVRDSNNSGATATSGGHNALALDMT